MEIKQPIPRYRGPSFHKRKMERIRSNADRLRKIVAAIAVPHDPPQYYDVWHADPRHDCPWKCRAHDPECLCAKSGLQ